jgi:hypothetical protein
MTPTAVLTLDRTTVSLSESLRATITVEGAAPLVVSAPKDVLTGAAAEAWRVRPAGPATVEQLPGGRERWLQAYRLDPYVPGEAVPAAFAPFEVTAGGGPAVRLTVDAREVRVETAIKQPKAADARPVTGIEELPPVPTTTWDPATALGVAGAVLTLTLAAVLWTRRRFRNPAVSPADWANRELDTLGERLAAATITPGLFAERLAVVVRAFLQRRSGVPATRMTTAELAAADPPLPGDVVLVLERCDLAKFAGQEPTAEECRELLERIRNVVVAGVVPNSRI